MLVKFSNNPLKQALGIVTYNGGRISSFLIISTLAVIQYRVSEWYGWQQFDLPVVPVSILGGALAIFLGFRNNSAYDRWWEARKIWGGIVNYSRSFGMLVMSFASPHHSNGQQSKTAIESWQKEMIYRHIAWLYALNMHLRKQFFWDKLDDYISPPELAKIKASANKPAQLINLQGRSLGEAYEKSIIEHFRHMEIANILKELYNLQGGCERIKNTIFPYYYNYFTRLFLWLFIFCLPFALVPEMGWMTIPMSVAIAFVFSILEKAGSITEEPFEGRAADTPITTISRAIEIDLLEMLGEKDPPKPLPAQMGRFGVEYFA